MHVCMFLRPTIHLMAGNDLFNDTLNTFYLRLYGDRHIVKDHTDKRKPAATTWATLSD